MEMWNKQRIMLELIIAVAHNGVHCLKSVTSLHVTPSINEDGTHPETAITISPTELLGIALTW